MSVPLSDALAFIEEFGPNCALGICCPPGQQRAVFASAMVKHCGLSADSADNVATWVLRYFDIVPKDSITPLLRAAGALAKAGTP